MGVKVGGARFSRSYYMIVFPPGLPSSGKCERYERQCSVLMLGFMIGFRSKQEFPRWYSSGSEGDEGISSSVPSSSLRGSESESDSE